MLKATELEELLDLLLFRPAAFVLVKLVQPTRITPNQITALSLVLGLASGWCFWQGTTGFYLTGSILLFLTNVFDCADGMLARLRASCSVLGYILDGLVDYLTHFAVLVGLLHGLAVQTGQPELYWLLSVPVVVSFAWWCAMVDGFRNEWLDLVYGRRRNPQLELEQLREQARHWQDEGSHRGQRVLIRLYAGYAGFWFKSEGDRSRALPPGVDLVRWQRARRPILRMAVLTGPTMHLFLIMVAGATDRMQWYVWFVLVFGTLWGLMVLALRAVVDRRLAAAGGEGASSESSVAGRG